MGETILVTSGTGNIGSAFVGELAGDVRRPTVRVATRSPQGGRARLLAAQDPETVKPVAFDVDDAASMRAALDGVTKVFVIAPFGGDMPAWHKKLAGALSAAGSIQHVVKVSVTGASNSGGIPLMHWLGEEALRATGLPVTCIRPTMFMQHFLNNPAVYQRAETKFHLPIGSAGVALLDCRDIASAGAALLMLDGEARKKHAGQAFELTGPFAVTAAQMADCLSWVAGRRIEHVDGEAAFVDHARALGVPDFTKAIYKEAAEGWFSKVEHAPFSELTGRLPASFAKFALDHAAHFGAKTSE